MLPGQQKAVASVFQYLPDSMATIFTLYALKVIEHINDVVPSRLLSLTNSAWLLAMPFIELFAPLIALPFAVLTAPIQSITSALLLPGGMIKGLTDILLGSVLDPVIGWLSYIKMNQEVFVKSLHNLLDSLAFPLTFSQNLLASLFAHPTTGLLNLLLAPIELLPAALIAAIRIPSSLLAFAAMSIMLPIVTLAAPVLMAVNVLLLPIDAIEVLGITISGAIAAFLVPGNLLKSLTAVRMLPATISIFINQMILTLFLAPIQLIMDMFNRLAGRSGPTPTEVLE